MLTLHGLRRSVVLLIVSLWAHGLALATERNDGGAASAPPRNGTAHLYHGGGGPTGLCQGADIDVPLRGFVNYHLDPAGTIRIEVHLQDAVPRDSYAVFARCLGLLGDIDTNSQGNGHGNFVATWRPGLSVDMSDGNHDYISSGPFAFGRTPAPPDSNGKAELYHGGGGPTGVCQGADIDAPTRGFVNYHLAADGNVTVNVHVRGALPNGGYEVYARCIGALGVIRTNRQGDAEGTFVTPWRHGLSVDMGGPAGDYISSGPFSLP